MLIIPGFCFGTFVEMGPSACISPHPSFLSQEWAGLKMVRPSFQEKVYRRAFLEHAVYTLYCTYYSLYTITIFKYNKYIK